MDLGASPLQALRRITLPLLAPAIFASAAIIFAFTLDDFVMVKQLAKDGSNETVAMAIYGAARTAPSPALASCWRRIRPTGPRTPPSSGRCSTTSRVTSRPAPRPRRSPTP